MSRQEYDKFTKAAKAAQVIDVIVPYEAAGATAEEAASHHNQKWFQDLLAIEGLSLDNLPEPPYDPPYDLLFCRTLRAGYEDALVALMLALLPNLRILELRAFPTEALEFLLPWNLPAHGFSQLVRITATNDCAESWPSSFLQDILGNTTLQTLELARVSLWYNSPNGPLQVPGFSEPLGCTTLTTLHLPNSAITGEEMQKLVSASSRLKRLYYSYNPYLAPGGCTAAELITLLEPFKHTLEELFLDIVHMPISLADLDDENEEDEEQRSSDHLIDSLSHFTALRRLDTTADVWRMLDEMTVANAYEWGPTDVSIAVSDRWCLRLPQHLELLCLHMNEDNAPADPRQLYDLITAQEQVLPELKELWVRVETKEDRTHFMDTFSMLAEKEEHPRLYTQSPLLVKIELASELSGPIETTFHDWRHPKERSRTTWGGHGYVLEPGRVQTDDEHDTWIRQVTGEAKSFDTGGYLSEEDIDIGMLAGAW